MEPILLFYSCQWQTHSSNWNSQNSCSPYFFSGSVCSHNYLMQCIMPRNLNTTHHLIIINPSNHVEDHAIRAEITNCFYFQDKLKTHMMRNHGFSADDIKATFKHSGQGRQRSSILVNRWDTSVHHQKHDLIHWYFSGTTESQLSHPPPPTLMIQILLILKQVENAAVASIWASDGRFDVATLELLIKRNSWTIFFIILTQIQSVTCEQ